jgi:hypothetical protein
MKLEDLPPVIDSEFAAGLLRCSQKTVEERMRTGDLPGEKFGEGWVVGAAAFLHRVNEICMERMLERRKRPEPSAVAANDGGRQPPKLPSLEIVK